MDSLTETQTDVEGGFKIGISDKTQDKGDYTVTKHSVR